MQQSGCYMFQRFFFIGVILLRISHIKAENVVEMVTREIYGKSIRCHTVVCNIKTIKFCTKDGGNDTCISCEEGKINPDRLKSWEWTDYEPLCAEANCNNCDTDIAVLANPDTCGISELAVCVCDRTRRWYGKNPRGIATSCQYQSGDACERTGFQLTQDGNCELCPSGTEKTTNDLSLCKPVVPTTTTTTTTSSTTSSTSSSTSTTKITSLSVTKLPVAPTTVTKATVAEIEDNTDTSIEQTSVLKEITTTSSPHDEGATDSLPTIVIVGVSVAIVVVLILIVLIGLCLFYRKRKRQTSTASEDCDEEKASVVGPIVEPHEKNYKDIEPEVKPYAKAMPMMRPNQNGKPCVVVKPIQRMSDESDFDTMQEETIGTEEQPLINNEARPILRSKDDEEDNENTNEKTFDSREVNDKIDDDDEQTELLKASSNNRHSESDSGPVDVNSALITPPSSLHGNSSRPIELQSAVPLSFDSDESSVPFIEPVSDEMPQIEEENNPEGEVPSYDLQSAVNLDVNSLLKSSSTHMINDTEAQQSSNPVQSIDLRSAEHLTMNSLLNSR